MGPIYRVIIKVRNSSIKGIIGEGIIGELSRILFFDKDQILAFAGNDSYVTYCCLYENYESYANQGRRYQ